MIVLIYLSIKDNNNSSMHIYQSQQLFAILYELKSARETLNLTIMDKEDDNKDVYIHQMMMIIDVCIW